MKKLFSFLFLFLLSISVFGRERNYDVEYTFLEAYRNRVAGNLSTSHFILNSILKVDSTCGVCYYELSRIYFESGSIDYALRFASRAYSIDSSNYWYAKNFADLLMAYGDSTYALKVYRRIVSFTDYNFNDVITFCRLAYNKKLFYHEADSLIRSLNQVTSSPEISLMVYLFKKSSGLSFLYLKNYLDSCFNLYPFYNDFLLEKAKLLAEKRKYKASRDVFRYLLQQDTVYIDALISYARFFKGNRDLKVIYNYLDSIFLAKHELSSKSKILQSLISINNESVNKYFDDKLIFILQRDSFPDYTYEHAYDFYSSRNNLSMLVIVGKLFVDNYPDKISAWSRYIFPLFISQKYSTLDSLLTEKPHVFSSPIGLYIAGFLKYNKKDFTSARNYFISCINLPGNLSFKTYAVNMLTDYYYSKGMADSAFYYYERALQEGYADETTMNNYAYYLSLSGKYLSKAEILSRAAILKYPKNSAFLDTYAWVLYKLKRYDEALTYIKRSIRYANKKEDNRVLYEHYSAILYCVGNREQSLKLLNKLFPDSKDLVNFFTNNVICE